MNRRKTVARSTRLRGLFGRPRNRRLRARTGQHTARASGAGKVEAPPPPGLDRPRLDLRATARRLLQVAIVGLKVVLVVALLAGAGVGGYVAYQRVRATTYFNIDTIEVDGARQAPVRDLTRMVATIKGQNIFSADLDTVRRSVGGHPWVKEARVSRVLPRTVRVSVVEHRAAALLLMGHLYLVSADGTVFKQADPDEQDGLPVITGLSRMTYLNQPVTARAKIDQALAALDRYYGQVRPPLSEISIGESGAITLFMRRGGVAVRMGAEVTSDRLDQLDAVWAALGPDVRRARVLFLNNEARADRVTVRMGRYE